MVYNSPTARMEPRAVTPEPLPPGWRAEGRSVCDQWMVFPPPGYGEKFPVWGGDLPAGEDFWPTIHRMIAERISEVDATGS